MNSDKFKDPKNLESILSEIYNTQHMLGIKEICDKYLPDWYVTRIDDYCDDYITLRSNHIKLCKNMKVTPKGVLLVKYLSSDNEYTLINTLAELFTRTGLAVRREDDFIQCTVCGAAIPNEMLFRKLADGNHRVPYIWSDKCSKH